VVMLEETASAPLSLPNGFAPLDERVYGDTRVTFLRWG